MITNPTLQMARRLFTARMDELEGQSIFAADRLAFQVAIDCIDFCIESNLRQQESRRADVEVAAAMRRLFEGRA